MWRYAPKKDAKIMLPIDGFCSILKNPSTQLSCSLALTIAVAKRSAIIVAPKKECTKPWNGYSKFKVKTRNGSMSTMMLDIRNVSKSTYLKKIIPKSNAGPRCKGVKGIHTTL